MGIDLLCNFRQRCHTAAYIRLHAAPIPALRGSRRHQHSCVRHTQAFSCTSDRMLHNDQPAASCRLRQYSACFITTIIRSSMMMLVLKADSTRQVPFCRSGKQHLDQRRRLSIHECIKMRIQKQIQDGHVSPSLFYVQVSVLHTSCGSALEGHHLSFPCLQ